MSDNNQSTHPELLVEDYLRLIYKQLVVMQALFCVFFVTWGWVAWTDNDPASTTTSTTLTTQDLVNTNAGKISAINPAQGEAFIISWDYDTGEIYMTSNTATNPYKVMVFADDNLVTMLDQTRSIEAQPSGATIELEQGAAYVAVAWNADGTYVETETSDHEMLVIITQNGETILTADQT